MSDRLFTAPTSFSLLLVKTASLYTSLTDLTYGQVIT